jgi:dihydrofolate reductase
VSRTAGLEAPGAEVVGSLAEAWRRAQGADEAFVIGGGELYAQALAEADRIYLTEVAADIEGDTYFPAPDPADWRESVLGEHAPDDRNPYALRFLLLERRRPPGAR